MNIIMILDESGSMGPLRGDTIGGFNRFLADQRALMEDEPAILHVAKFNNVSGIRRPIWGKDVRDVKNFAEKDYVPVGGTPLLDAVGEVVENASGDKGLIVITTDGEENASHRYTKDKVKKLLAKKQKQGWTVLFFGANIDSFAEAGQIGISRRTTANYGFTGMATQSLYNATSMAATHLRRTRGAGGQSMGIDTDDEGNVNLTINNNSSTGTPTTK